MPLSIVSNQKLPSTLFYVLVLLGLIVLAQRRFAGTLALSKHNYAWLTAMGAPLLALIWSAIYNGKIEGLDLEVALRFLLGSWLLFLAYSQLPKIGLQKALMGFYAACAVASLFVFYLAINDPGRPQTSVVYNAVGYASITVLLASIVAFSLKISNNNGATYKSAVVIKSILVLAALYAVVLTMTRTAWVAVPAFILIGAALYKPPKKLTQLIWVALLAILVIGAITASSEQLRNRIATGFEQISTCTGAQATSDNSMCIRLQLWRASADMIAKRPLAGTGSKRYFNDYLVAEDYSQGKVSEYVAKGWGEPHNDLLLYLTSFGIPGGIALLLVYLVPAWHFMRRMYASNPHGVRAAAAMGLAVCLGFMIFGLTETMFRSMRTVSFYSMCMAFFMALSNPSRPDNGVTN